MTYNTYLLPREVRMVTAPKAPPRQATLGPIIDEADRRLPDLLGLCEVFEENEREMFREALKDTYPWSLEGPDSAGVEGHSGIVLLSRHPFSQQHVRWYPYGEGFDKLSQKGLVHVRVSPPDGTECDVFLTHMQSVSDGDGTRSLKRQLTYLSRAMEAYSDPKTPSFIMGDLNVNARNRALYLRMLSELQGFTDPWTFLHPEDPGLTTGSQRLDCVLRRPGYVVRPLAKSAETLNLVGRTGHYISDHKGLATTFEGGIETVSLDEGDVEKVTVWIRDIHVLQDSESGEDDYSFHLTLSDETGRKVASHTPTFDVNFIPHHERFPRVPDAAAISVLEGPIQTLKISVGGVEHDSVSADDVIGERHLYLQRSELTAFRGRTIQRVLPLLTGEGVQAVGVDIQVE